MKKNFANEEIQDNISTNIHHKKNKGATYFGRPWYYVCTHKESRKLFRV